MTTYLHTYRRPIRLRLALVSTGIAASIAFLASLNLYLLEDRNPLTTPAYSSSPLLRFSYDGAYLSALVIVIACCGLIGYALTHARHTVVIAQAVVALLVLFAGFGGLLVRAPLTFFLLLLVFVAVTLLSILAALAVAARLQARSGERAAALLGGCVGVGVVLLVSLATLTLHTLLLNPIGHELYMQGQIGTTHLNSLLLAMGLGLLSTLVCWLCIGLALRSALRSSS